MCVCVYIIANRIIRRFYPSSHFISGLFLRLFIPPVRLMDKSEWFHYMLNINVYSSSSSGVEELNAAMSGHFFIFFSCWFFNDHRKRQVYQLIVINSTVDVYRNVLLLLLRWCTQPLHFWYFLRIEETRNFMKSRVCVVVVVVGDCAAVKAGLVRFSRPH